MKETYISPQYNQELIALAARLVTQARFAPVDDTIEFAPIS